MTKTQPTTPLAGTTGAGPRIYLACLAAYNSGRLHGAWIEADKGEDHIWDGLRAMLKHSPDPSAEEWAIHAYDGFEGMHLSESTDFRMVCALAEFIAEHGELGVKILDHFSADLDQARSAFDEYAGEYNSAAEFAEQLHDDIGTEIPKSLKFYIDWQALARDMDLNGEIIAIELGFGHVHIFWAR